MIYDENDSKIIMLRDKAITMEKFRETLEIKKTRLKHQEPSRSKHKRITLTGIKDVFFFVSFLGAILLFLFLLPFAQFEEFSKVIDRMFLLFTVFLIIDFLIIILALVTRMSYKKQTVTCVGYLYRLTRYKKVYYLQSAPLFMFRSVNKNELIYDRFLNDTTKAPDLGDEAEMRIGRHGAEDCYLKLSIWGEIGSAFGVLVLAFISGYIAYLI